ncbi:hypothetical protein FA15DRAFT_658776 [Coprinopsis marcescibilis]|uniref:Uncharacterized protein n=1 Tax=Coprinopsis marcescibilis TaxID=230819 RepID=A0A5C3KKZ4_COPMA|nr:hypothetical protein FA15DRAFT_658776 [Coprinopsis marcescibilis]
MENVGSVETSMVSLDLVWEIFKYTQAIDNLAKVMNHQGITDQDALSNCLVRNCALIGGPCIMATWYPMSSLQASHLEIYCPFVPKFQDDILSFLQMAEGFHVANSVIRDSPNTSSRKFAFVYPEFSNTVKAVHTSTKKKTRNTGHSNGEYQCMVIASMFWGTALLPILKLPNTMVMTFFTGKELYTLYPFHTLCGTGIMNFDGPVNASSIPVTQQFAEQQFLMHGGEDHNHQCGYRAGSRCMHSIQNSLDGKYHRLELVGAGKDAGCNDVPEPFEIEGTYLFYASGTTIIRQEQACSQWLVTKTENNNLCGRSLAKGPENMHCRAQNLGNKVAQDPSGTSLGTWTRDITVESSKSWQKICHISAPKHPQPHSFNHRAPTLGFISLPSAQQSPELA